jgi:hypothetical protein
MVTFPNREGYEPPCTQVDPDMFTPDAADLRALRAAARHCARCELRPGCADYATAERRDGVWGGRWFATRNGESVPIPLAPPPTPPAAVAAVTTPAPARPARPARRPVLPPPLPAVETYDDLMRALLVERYGTPVREHHNDRPQCGAQAVDNLAPVVPLHRRKEAS